MKVFLLTLMMLGFMPELKAAENLDCDGGDRHHAVCQQRPVGGSRCTGDDAIKWNCKQPGAINPTLENHCNRMGGCFGRTESGNWFTYTDSMGTVRCRCGCFAEETIFETIDGPLAAGDMPGLTSFPALFGSDSLEFGDYISLEAINIVSGPEKDPVYTFVTESGNKITVSDKHPVVISSSQGGFEKVITADQVKTGDFLVKSDGTPTSVIALRTSQYHGKVINFDMRGTKPEHHIIVANGLKMGDNVWQQKLAKVESRMMNRDDLVLELVTKNK
ncbi:MAG: hypothetical protein CL429_01855 [Acidimicrobiaceae bacterium]|nr:hypothetical protein [Acidimicrobiaceae bacterium]